MSKFARPADYWVYCKTQENQTISSNWVFTKPVTGVPATYNNQFITLGQANILYSGGGFILTNGSGTTANSSAVDLGGTLTQSSTNLLLGTGDEFILGDSFGSGIDIQSQAYTSLTYTDGPTTGGLLMGSLSVGFSLIYNFNGGEVGFNLQPLTDTAFVFVDTVYSIGLGDATDYSANKTDFSYVTKKWVTDNFMAKTV